MVFRTIALESTLPPHSDSAARRVSEGLTVAFTRRANFCCTTCWRVLLQSKMSAVLMVVEQVGRQQSCETPLYSASRRATTERHRREWATMIFVVFDFLPLRLGCS